MTPVRWKAIQLLTTLAVFGIDLEAITQRHHDCLAFRRKARDWFLKHG